MEGYFSTGQSPLWAVVPMEEVHLQKTTDVSEFKSFIKCQICTLGR